MTPRTTRRSADADQHRRPPCDGLVRASRPGFALRAAPEGGMPTLVGHFAVFNTWAEIDSIFEGRFLERIAPGALARTFVEDRDAMRCLFQHGFDYVAGDKPLGPIDQLREDDVGGYYEVPLLDASYVRDIIPGLEASLYGASFRFRVTIDEFVEEPDPSDYNPRGLPERTITEMRVSEFGPVTFPAYPQATAGLRSLTDRFVFRRLVRDPDELREKLGTRVDPDAVSTLGQMITLGASYVDDEDDPDDAAAMQAVLNDLGDLLQSEIAEPDDDGEEADEGAPPAPAAGEAASNRPRARGAMRAALEQLGDLPRSTSASEPADDPQPEGDTGERSRAPEAPTPLFAGRKEPSWRL